MRQTSCLKLMDEPLVFVTYAGSYLLSGLSMCLDQAKGRPFHLLIVPNWEVRTLLPVLDAFVRTAALLNSGITPCILSPGDEENALLEVKGLRHVHAHHNAFIDETVFHPSTDERRIYDAIYIAAMQTWKRHDLAWNIPNICVLTYGHGRGDDTSVMSGYSSLAYSNCLGGGDVEFLAASDVAAKINQSRVGLILSAREGGNFASGEYQFCGLPVITTPSTGGRHYFLDSKTTIVVQPTAESVEKAVVAANGQTWDATAIHRRAVARAIPHRERLLTYLSQISGRDIRAEANGNAWHPAFSDKLRCMIPIPGT